MLSYGGSITSAFPNTFCSSPASLTCQLCNTCINDTSTALTSSVLTGSGFGSVSGGLNSLGVGSAAAMSSSTTTALGGSANGAAIGLNKLEKCTHCGINICERCFNENQECAVAAAAAAAASGAETGEEKSKNSVATAHVHYNTVKKEFKQMYNYSKEIVEKLHLLNNTIKMEESAVSELNLIKHQVNTKAIELIKQINQEKTDLIEQIENVKRKYESYEKHLIIIEYNSYLNF